MLSQKKFMCGILLALYCTIGPGVGEATTNGDEMGTSPGRPMTWTGPTVILNEVEFIEHHLSVNHPCGRESVCNNFRYFSNAVPDCRCDDFCRIFGDCCIDAPQQTTEIPARIAALEDRIACLTSNADGRHSHEVFTIHACSPDFADLTIRTRCEENMDALDDIYLRTPVSEKEHGVVFKNIFCALCNGWHAHEILFWQVSMTCEKYIPFTPEEPYQPRPELIEYDYEASRFITLGDDKQELGPIAEPQNALSETEDSYRSNITSVLVNGSIADILAEKVCRNEIVFSAPASVPKPRKCLPYKSTCPSDWEDEHVADLCHNHTSMIIFQMRYSVFKNRYCAECNFIGLYPDLISCSGALHQPPKRLDPGVGRLVSFSVMIDLNLGEGRLISNIAEDDQTDLESKGSCQEGQRYDPYRDTCRQLVCPSGWFFIGNKCHQSPGPRRSYSPTRYRPTVSSRPMCPGLEIEAEEFHVLDNGSIWLNRMELMIGETDYHLTEHNNKSFIIVCETVFSQNRTTRNSTSMQAWRNYDSAIQGLITHIGLCVSIVCLFILLAIYSWLRPLRNTPGKNLMCLSGCLLCGQLSFIIGAHMLETTAFCVANGVATHLSYLAAFFWMNAMAFDIWKTFHHLLRHSGRRDDNKLFKRYAFYAFGAPIIIVGSCLVLDLVSGTPESLKPFYGKTVCWISNGYVLLGFFAVPLGLIICANIIFFIFSVISIGKSSQNTVLGRGNKQEGVGIRQRLLLYTKLSVIMGFTWAFGFTANFSRETPVLWYLFIIFNTLQGLFICLAFVCNRKVLELLRRSCTGRKQRGSSDHKDTAITKKTTV